MDARSRLRRAVAHPVLFLRHANRLYHRRLGLRKYDPDGIDIFEKDWDNLFILDGCRYDLFEARSDLPGRLSAVRSRASCTPEFLRANFDGRTLHDTVYVTANPMPYRRRESLNYRFHDVIHVWRDAGWDEDHGTVVPETTTEYAVEAAERYPDKRLIVHFLQPHYPFIVDTEFDKTDLEAHVSDRGPSIWDRLITGEATVPQETVWKAYARNLEVALPHVKSLMTALEGRTVVTSDHGNMVGERSFPVPIREWGHPRGIYTEKAMTVPWLEFENGPRRRIQAEEPAPQEDDVNDSEVLDRLRHLGYAE
ncbi:hypothetical protein BRC90_01750 [Halobacteriales archaeon QS_4_69_34]|nr:MAG: hypothetical protein BRC90_01750 [Halobacteriales archaeon QS_4_69_34]